MPGENDDPLNVPGGDAALERFKKIREELEAMRLPELPADEFESRKEAIAKLPSSLPDVPKLEDIRPDAWRGKERHDNQKEQSESRKKGDYQATQGLGVGLIAAYMILGFPALGIAVGWVADYLLKVNEFKGLGAIAGMAVGLIGLIAVMNGQNKR